MLGGGGPSTGQSMVSDLVALVRKAFCPMLMLMCFFKVVGEVSGCLMITGLLPDVFNGESSDQLGSLSVGQM